jgi:hypothetical protein
MILLEAVKLRQAGRTFQQIGEALGVSTHDAHRLVIMGASEPKPDRTTASQGRSLTEAVARLLRRVARRLDG